MTENVQRVAGYSVHSVLGSYLYTYVEYTYVTRDVQGFCGEDSGWTLGLLLADVLPVVLVQQVFLLVGADVLAVQTVACH